MMKGYCLENVRHLKKTEDFAQRESLAPAHAVEGMAHLIAVHDRPAVGLREAWPLTVYILPTGATVALGTQVCLDSAYASAGR